MFRKAVFWLHLICGVGVGAVVFTMSATGVALTYEKQIARWADGFHVAPPPGAAPLDPEALLTLAGEDRTGLATGITFESDPAAPARVSFGRESVAVNPYTGEAMGEGAVGVHGFFRTMISWHRWLGQEGEGREAGKAITGASNLAFLFIVISGLYLWWPKKWTGQYLRPIVWFRGGLSPKARDFNWHNVAGFWCAVPLLFVVATAVFFSYPWAGEALYALTGEAQAGRGGQRRPEGAIKPVADGLNEAWASAKTAAPGWKTMSLRLAAEAGGPIVVSVDRGFGGRPDLKSTLTLDAATGSVLRNEVFADQGPGRRVRSWIRWIHTGEAGGLPGQTIAGVASLAACLLVYTGWMLSWRRFRAWLARR